VGATYKVTVKGVAPSVPLGEAIKNLASLFRASEAQVQNIVASGNAVVKKNISLQDAAKYQAAIEKCGVMVVVEPEFEERLSFDVTENTPINDGKKTHINNTKANEESVKPRSVTNEIPMNGINCSDSKPIAKRKDLTFREKFNKYAGIAILALMVIVALPNMIGDWLNNGNEKAIIDKIWANYMKASGANGSGEEYLKLQGHLLKKGSVPPAALNSSAEGRLPAYLACYDYIFVLPGLGDSKQNMCVFYMSNPTRGTMGVQWRGKQYLGNLEQIMAAHGFVEDKK